MHTLGIDIETYSSISLAKAGVYRYIEAPDFEVMLIGYCLDDSHDVHVIDLTEEELPTWFAVALLDSNFLKTAHNAQFELLCLAKWIGLKLDPAQWECTMIKAAMLGYPMSLEKAAHAMKINAEKDRAGKALIKLFTMPRKKDGLRIRSRHDPQKWILFKDYCRQDVYVEQAIKRNISWFKVGDMERRLWILDQKINNTGVLLDVPLIQQAIALNDVKHEQLMKEAIALTGLANPNSVAQLKTWLSEETDGEITSVTKDSVALHLDLMHDQHVQDVLLIRQQMSKSSIKKYKAMMEAKCIDGRIRGMFQLYGASKTGRWSARIVQLHNLPKNTMDSLDLARMLVKQGNTEMVELMWGNLSNVLSELIRTAFVPAPGKTLIVSDYSAIEARITAWLADETWRMEVFRTHGKVYEASGAAMFKVPIESITKGSKLRDKAKIAELALGYQGSVGAMEKMGAIEMGLTEEELLPLVQLWRKTNPNIVRFWYAVDEAAINAVAEPGEVFRLKHGLEFFVKNNVLFIRLPSGRLLTYLRPKLRKNKFDRQCVTFEGIDQRTRQWKVEETYGGKLVENIVQGTARDVLAWGMLELDAAGLDIILHVHDETALETESKNLKKAGEIMAADIPWAIGLPLAAESFETQYYKKD